MHQRIQQGQNNHGNGLRPSTQTDTIISVSEEMEVDDADDPGEDPMIMEVDDDRHVRRSGRVTRPPRNLSPQTRGASHVYSRASRQGTTIQRSCDPKRGGTCRGRIEPITPGYRTRVVWTSRPSIIRLTRSRESHVRAPYNER